MSDQGKNQTNSLGYIVDDSSSENFQSFHLKSHLSAERIEKVHQETNTDPQLLKCDCEEIPKLKEKAHNSFMQVIQIQNLYKEEIVQLKEYYRQRQKNKDNQYKYKEELLSQKCRELQAQIDKVKKNCGSIPNVQTELGINPFIVDSIDTINFDLDESNQSSIFNLKQFVGHKNLQESVTGFEQQIKQKLNQIQITLANPDKVQTLIKEAISIVGRIFQFTKELKEQTVIAYEKYNDGAKIIMEVESKYNKMMNSYQSLQKECKFMTDHIKKLSNEKIKMEQKYNQLERKNKALEEYIKYFKKIAQEKGINLGCLKKETEVVQREPVVTIDDNGQIDVSLGSIPITNNQKKKPLRTNSPLQGGFKKKMNLFQKIQK